VSEDLEQPTHPDVTPEPPAPPAPDPVAVPPARPMWTYFLMPVAVVLGAAAIAGAIIWVWGDDSSSTPGTEAASTVPARQGGGSLLDTLVAYGTEVGLDEAKYRECLASDEPAALMNSHLRTGVELGVNATPTFFINNKVLIGNQPFAVLEEIVERELSDAPTDTAAYSDPLQQLAAAGRFRIADRPPGLDGAEIKGNPGAPVVIAEFSDFQCPFCKRWVDQSYGALQGRLGDDVALAFLHFPIVQIHPNAGNAGAAAICAGEQGKFWEMHDLLFARQEQWQVLR